MNVVSGWLMSEVATYINLPEKPDTTPIGEFQGFPLSYNRVYVIWSFGSVVRPRLFVKGGKLCVLAESPRLYTMSLMAAGYIVGS
jgi:hypothetical protein